ncbi:hypothetical protein [Pseudonocardia sp. UM4_GMWB1]|uniref:hypothetical protein n=1 Tax=Pseudonocardia sp. UM4_GMWB1 TaxID=2212989 RepID=UPI00307DA45A
MTTPQDTPTHADIARRAGELKVFMLAMNLGIPAMFLPSLPLLTISLQLTDAPPSSDLPVDLVYGEDDGTPRERLRFSAREILTTASRLRGPFLMDVMSTGMITGAIVIGDMIDKGGHRDKSVPLLEFARHYRNACAHGNAWHLNPGEPRHPAACRHLALTADLNGQEAAWRTVGPRLHVEFLDDIANHFVPGSAPAPGKIQL